MLPAVPQLLPNTPPPLNLPADVLDMIVPLLLLADLRALSLVSRATRQLVAPYLFSAVSATWLELLSSVKLRQPSLHPFTKEAASPPDTTLFDHFPQRHHVLHLSITDLNPAAEWGFQLAPRFATLPRLRLLALTILNSSLWLKYQQISPPSHITRLHLCNTSTLPLLMGHLFTAGHLRGCPTIRRLSLKSFHLAEANEPMPPLQLDHLTLHDCYWEYPFSPGQLDSEGTITHLELTYTSAASFVLSERFRSFMKAPVHGKELSRVEHFRLQTLGITSPLSGDLLDAVSTVFHRLTHLWLIGWAAGGVDVLLRRHIQPLLVHASPRLYRVYLGVEGDTAHEFVQGRLRIAVRLLSTLV